MFVKSIKACIGLGFLVCAFLVSAHQSLDTLADKLTLKNAASYSQNYITGGQPTIDDLKMLANAGVKVVINLRDEGEFSKFNEQSIVEDLGMKYTSLPIAGAKGVTAENVKKFHQLITNNNEKTLVHCASGNRVGAFFALEAFNFKNKTAAEALKIGKQTGLTRLEKLVKKQMNVTKEL